MATNSEHPHRFDLRTTIPLATETLVNLAKQPKRSWIVPTLTLITGIAFGFLMLELLVFPGPASALGFEGGLRSRLSANYGMDPIAARIHELRLTIVEDVLGFDDGGGSEPSAISLLMRDPVPTATPKATTTSNPTSESTVSPAPTSALTDVPEETPVSTPADTPLPPTAAALENYCGNLSIFDVKVKGGDDVVAKVRNGGPMDVYLIKTVFEWPDVPEPAYVDYFELDGIPGNDKYYNSNDWNSPTISTGDYEKLRHGKTEDWKVDFDDEPDGIIYGSFSLTLTFDVPGQDTDCSMSRSIFKSPPSPTSEPTGTALPSETPEIAPTETTEPTVTPAASSTPVSTATPEPTETATAPTPEPDTPTPDV